MRIFFNDIPLIIIPKGQANIAEYQVTIQTGGTKITPEQLLHNVLITGATRHQVKEVIQILSQHIFNQASSITLEVDNFEKAKSFVKSFFRIVHAAGGVVSKSGKVLMIYRLKKWDLPKGKLDKNEKPKAAALREVQEECGVLVKSRGKICKTWHTYSLNGKNILKKTSWYAMDCLDDKRMAPQANENIEEVRWLKTRDLFHALKDSYASIRYVFQQYKTQTIASN